MYGYGLIPLSRRLTEDEESHMKSKWLEQRSMTPTQYGYVTNLDWCRKEADRMGGCLVLHYIPSNKICIIKEKINGELFKP